MASGYEYLDRQATPQLPMGPYQQGTVGNSQYSAFDYANPGISSVKDAIGVGGNAGAGQAGQSANAWTGNMGYLGAGAAVIGAGINAYTGLKGLGLAEDQFEFNKSSWEKNFAMMQDQYYRKLNRGRSNREIINGGIGSDGRYSNNANEIANYYDSGANLQGSAGTWANSQNPAPVNGPTTANATMSATGSPFNLVTKQAALGAPGVAPLSGPTNPAIAAGMGTAPVTAAGSALQNTSIGPKGTIKKRVKKRNPQNSNDNANDSEVTS